MKSTITVTRSARHPETCHDVIIRPGGSESSINLSNIPRGFSLQGNIQSAIGEVLCTWADVAAAIGEFEKMAASVKGLSVRSITLKVPGELEMPDTAVFERMAGEIREANDRPGKNTEVKIEASAGKQGTSAFVEVRQTEKDSPFHERVREHMAKLEKEWAKMIEKMEASRKARYRDAYMQLANSAAEARPGGDPPDAPQIRLTLLPKKEEATKASRELAAQAWCQPSTSDREMDPELAEQFALILDRANRESKRIIGDLEAWKEAASEKLAAHTEPVNEAGKSSKTTFEQELRGLINRHSMENGSNTPDHVLARFLTKTLNEFNAAVASRHPGVYRPKDF